MTGEQPSSSSWTASRWLQVGGLAVMAIGLLMSWVSAGFVSVNGIDTDDGQLFGILLLGLAGAVALSEARRGRWWILVAIGGVLLLAFAIYEVGHVYDYEPRTTTIKLDASPGTGLWFDVIGGATLLFGVAMRDRPDS